MHFFYRFFDVLTWKIPNQTDWQNWVAFFVAKYEKIHGRIIEEFGPDGVLIVALFALFLVLLCVIYIKAVIDAFRSEDQTTDQLDEFLSEVDEEAAAQLEAEKELSLSLVEASADSDDILGVREDYERLKEVMQQHAHIQQETIDTEEHKIKEARVSAEQLRLRELMSIIVKMLARGVSEHKIAQSISNRLRPQPEFEDILQAIRSVQDFIGLANAGVFADLPMADKLPKPQDALRILCEKGDNSLCLDLLQKLTSQYVDDAMPEKGITRQMLLAQASNFACLTGNFAWFDDVELAQTSFNFATEISAENVNAWSRLGDAYMRQGNPTKAMFAYQSVMELAEMFLYEQQLANARHRLAVYYRSEGMNDRAEEYAKAADRYYQICGKDEPLSLLEEAAADLIVTRQEIGESLELLLPPFL